MNIWVKKKIHTTKETQVPKKIIAYKIKNRVHSNMFPYILTFAFLQVSNVICSSNKTLEEEDGSSNPGLIPVIITSSLVAFLLYMVIIYSMFRTIRYTSPYLGPWTLFLLFFFPPSLFFLFFWVYLLGRQVSYKERVYMYPDPDSRYSIRGPPLSQPPPQSQSQVQAPIQPQTPSQFQTQSSTQAQQLPGSNVPPLTGYVGQV